MRQLRERNSSVLTSVVYVGRIVGVFIFEPFAERFGFKKLFIFIIALQTIAAVLQLAAQEWIQL